MKTLAPAPAELLARARTDLRSGLPVCIGNAEGGFLIAAAETVPERRLSELLALDPDAVLAITDHRARTLNVPAYDGDLVRLALGTGADAEWVRAVAEPARDLATPMKGPLRAVREGDPGPARLAIALAKSAQLLPAVIVARAPAGFAPGNAGLTVLPKDVAAAALATAQRLREVVSARVPLALAENGRLHVFRPEEGGEEHYAVEIGQPSRSEPVLARLHSACFTGDLLGSLKCDCGPQLHAALRAMGEAGGGVLLYLNQEGRGIGLANKMRAYALQDQGFDTVEANHRLGFEDDERDFRLGAAILAEMGFSAVRLMTNNPAKVRMMEENGIKVVERVPLRVGETDHNRAYLATKARKSGHLL